MPISESDYDDEQPCELMATSTTTSTMTKAEIRKTHKPIMEKRRRAKINNCLNEIKDLILSAMKKDPERHSKLEKADILEMAVKHLKGIQRQQKEIAIRSDPSAALKYKTGYRECASDVSSYVEQLAGIDSGLKHRLSKHLTHCASSIEQPSSRFATFASSTLLASFAAQSRFNNNKTAASDDEPNNNNNNNSGDTSSSRIELIPSCLPNGDVAFLLPKSSFSSILGVNRGIEEGSRTSAFVTVTPRAALSPPPSPPAVKVHKPRAEKPTAAVSLQIQHIKFPIHNARKEMTTTAEPLCIITNTGERYRHAQQVDDSRHSDENVFLGLGLAATGGVKRKAKDEGLLAVAPCAKIARIERAAVGSAASAFHKLTPTHVFDNDTPGPAPAASPEDENQRNDSMWRPW